MVGWLQRPTLDRNTATVSDGLVIRLIENHCRCQRKENIFDPRLMLDSFNREMLPEASQGVINVMNICGSACHEARPTTDLTCRSPPRSVEPLRSYARGPLV